MSSFSSQLPDVLTGFLTNRLRVSHSQDLDESLGKMTSAVPAITLSALSAPQPASTLTGTSPTPAPAFASRPTQNSGSVFQAGDSWLNIVHVLPRSITLGNVVTMVTRTIDIYNAYLFQSHDLQAFINNAGAGVSITNLPALPRTIPPQSSLSLTLSVNPNGASSINSTLDFDTDEPYLLSVPITGTRIVVFPFEPESPLTERLLFLTDILEAKDGTEQRVSLRQAPRQEFDLKLLRDDGPDRQRVDLLLFDWQSRVFGLPVWTEPSYLTSAVTVGQTSVSVDDTTLGDFRVNGFVIVFEGEDRYEALEVQSVGPTTISFKTALQNNYSIGTRVMPMRTAVTSAPAQDRRYPVNLAEISVTMRVLDNEVDLSGIGGWPTYNSKVLLSDPNAIETTLDGNISRQIVVFDSAGTGKFSLGSTWDRARRGSAKTFLTRTRSALWSVRRLLHYLRGSQVSFYLPTFSQDLTLASTYTSGSSSMTIVNVGYSKYARQRTPRADIRIVLTSGVVFARTITASAELTPTTEQITLSSSIGQNIAPTDVARIEFVEKTRIDGEEIAIEHRSSNGEARVGFPVKVVLE